MNAPISVSTLNTQIKALLESTFERVWVEGEISNLTYHSSGHVYFSLKDERSTISCVLFRGNASRLKFRLEEGMQVQVEGGLTLYLPRGSYQINCFAVQPAGIGALALAYEQLKKKLESQGYFDRTRKQPIPDRISHLVLVTSATGAAIQDMLKVAHRRWPLLKITLIDTLVQGEGAAPDIVRSLAHADSLGADVIVLGRGGGSLEDLWAFNEETVAEAVFATRTPIVSAVGHESDVMISDFVADLRAPTPSAAMEMILPDRSEMLLYLDSLMEELDRRWLQGMGLREERLMSLTESFRRHSISNRIEMIRRELEQNKILLDEAFRRNWERCAQGPSHLQERFNLLLPSIFSRKQNVIESLQQSYRGNNPSERVKQGYAQVVLDGKPASLEKLENSQSFQLEDSEYTVLASVIDKQTRK